MDKTKEILDIIFSTPIHNWSGDKLQLNGLNIEIHRTHSNYPKFLLIDGIAFTDDRVYLLISMLDSIKKLNGVLKTESKIDEIHSKISK